MKRLALVLCFALSGCVTALTAAGEKVHISNAADGCEAVGEVHGVGETGTVGDNIESARADIRNKAGERGANVVVLQTNNQYGARVDLTGQAYRCASATN